jgi:hypothetical protein
MDPRRYSGVPLPVPEFIHSCGIDYIPDNSPIEKHRLNTLRGQRLAPQADSSKPAK